MSRRNPVAAAIERFVAMHPTCAKFRRFAVRERTDEPLEVVRRVKLVRELLEDGDDSLVEELLEAPTPEGCILHVRLVESDWLDVADIDIRTINVAAFLAAHRGRRAR
jgi:hypothetical protein